MTEVQATDQLEVRFNADHRAGGWVRAQANDRLRSALFASAALVVAFAVSAVLWFSGQRLLGVLAYAGFLCFFLAVRGFLAAAEPWAKGAYAEEAVGAELEELRRDGYVVLHDVMFGGEGNVDHLVSGANGVFMVETKFGYYDDAHLGRAKRSARRLHDELGCWVTPVICSGKRDRTFVHKGVMIAGRGMVADAIRAAQPRRMVDPTRLADFAYRVL